MHNKLIKYVPGLTALHRTAFPLRSKAAAYFRRYALILVMRIWSGDGDGCKIKVEASVKRYR
ncbi:hypothetical protein DET64_11113 [Marinobacter nauticus]|uniref:Uncharacterized protein n=1 Tax=Marinobacter nauticus TaxID=2743 RepID=A0A368UTV3_MARNT|nr:hypothetical protein DET64_11113 [Marinobacter nauticus]RCW31470.1 hypothetical protein DET51_11113 [Marinobacter nauticus]